MGINFPNTPAIGDTWPNPPVATQPTYTWDGEKWTTGSSVGGVVRYDVAATADNTAANAGRAKHCRCSI